MERIQDKTEGFPVQRSNGKRYIGFADDIDYDYILESILDHIDGNAHFLFEDAGAPAKIADSDDEGITYVQMPMRV